MPEANPDRFDCAACSALRSSRPLSAESFQRFQSFDVRQVFAGHGRLMAAPCRVHCRRTKTNLISGETVLSPLLADLRSPPGFSLSTCCFQNSFLLRDLSRLCPKDSGNAEDSRKPDALESLALAVPLRLLRIPSASPSPRLPRRHFRDHRSDRFARAPALPLDSLGPRPHLHNIGL
jgi:hypothetical protein